MHAVDPAVLRAFEQDSYEELYHFGDTGRSLVLDRVSGRVLLKKELSLYNEEVYRYLKEHPNRHVPGIRSIWREREKLVVVEELVSGETLAYLLQNRTLSYGQRVDIALQICDGLSFLHSAEPKIIHRDLKASNVMVTDDGVAKIIDYDAAKVFDERETKDTILIGTRGSAAPEQYGFGKVDARTDIYALGVLLRDLFPGDKKMQKIADHATELSPKDRYQSAEEVREAISGRKRQKEKKGFRFRIPWLPGFRTGDPAKMLLGVFWYTFILYGTFTMKPSENRGAQPAEIWGERLAFLMILLSLTDLFADGTGLFRRFRLLRSENWLLRGIGYALFAMGIVLFWVLLFAVMIPGFFA